MASLDYLADYKNTALGARKAEIQSLVGLTPGLMR